VIIPPRSTAVMSESGTTRRDAHLRTIERHGRIGRQRRSGYCRRSLVETAIFRYKTIIGRRLHARTLPNQKTEARTGCAVLNRMTSLGMPVSVASNRPRTRRVGAARQFFMHQRVPRSRLTVPASAFSASNVIGPPPDLIECHAVAPRPACLRPEDLFALQAPRRAKPA
jgi:hypothetical protein